MSRLSSFILGFIVGAVSLYVAISFHIVRAEDGHHLVPKTSLGFSDTYVDIRGYTISDWREHVPLAQAIVKAEKQDLLKDAAQISFQNTFEDLFPSRRR